MLFLPSYDGKSALTRGPISPCRTERKVLCAVACPRCILVRLILWLFGKAVTRLGDTCDVQFCSALTLVPEQRMGAQRVSEGPLPSMPLPPSIQVAGGNSSHEYAILEGLVGLSRIWKVAGSTSVVHHWPSCRKIGPWSNSGQMCVFFQFEGQDRLRRLSDRPLLMVLKSYPYHPFGNSVLGCGFKPR